MNGYIYGKNDYDAETAFEEVYRFNPKVSEDPLDITRIHPEHYGESPLTDASVTNLFLELLQAMIQCGEVLTRVCHIQ